MQNTADVVLINMPFTALTVPSLGLSLLKAGLARAGIGAQVLYCSHRFAALIGEPLYTEIADNPHRHDLVGEWFFTAALFGSGTSDGSEPYVENVLRGRACDRTAAEINGASLPESVIAAILQARTRIEPFLAECVEAVLAYQPKVIGFTSVFQQQIASLALAQRLKARAPDTTIVFGGANCEGVMGQEVVRQFSFVDAVVSGEGDAVFPELVQRVLAKRSLGNLPDVVSRERLALPTLASIKSPASMIESLDVLPYPNYDDYFEQLAAHDLPLSSEVRLLFETSRGCWWGEKQHCTFCGLNGETMKHRSKSATRALNELVWLTEKHPGHPVFVVDNILDMGYFKDFLPALAARRLGVELFYEVKANLKKEQVEMLYAAGVTGIQPGIESLSDEVLRLMRKGVRALQNIQLLKWCAEVGVLPEWNFLWGFPGEAPAEYQRMAESVPLLTHLPPPTGASKIRIDRFSPNFNEATELGFTNLRPHPAYHHIYPFAPDVVARLAYFFDYDYRVPQQVANYAQPLADAIQQWRAGYAESELFGVEKGEELWLWDTRPCAPTPLTILNGVRKWVYQACGQIRTPPQLLAAWHKLSEEPLDAPLDAIELDLVLAEFTAQGIMLRQDNSYLALALSQS